MVQDKEKEYYTIKVACSNCGKGNAFEDEDIIIPIPKGIMVNDYLISLKCENCGCTTLSPIMNYVKERKAPKEIKEDKETIEDTSNWKAIDNERIDELFGVKTNKRRRK